MKKIIIFILLTLIVCFCFAGCQIGNRQIGFDTTQTFNEAIVYAPSGNEIIRGKVDSWRDFNESDVVQITINGITYLTHYSNVILIKNG